MSRTLTIRQKIVLGFCAVLLCAAGLGFFADNRLGAVNRSAAEVRDVSLPATRSLGAVAYHTMRYRQIEAVQALAADPSARAKETETLRSIQDQATAALAEYRSVTDDVAGADELARDWAGYQASHAHYMDLIESNKGAAAIADYVGSMRTGFNLFQHALQEQIERCGRQGEEAGRQGEQLGTAAQWLILFALLITGALCTAIGWVLCRTVSEPLARMTRAMDGLADGQLSISIPCADRGDEIGRLAASMAVFKENALAAREAAAAQERQRMAKERRAKVLGALVHDFEARIGEMVGVLSSAATELEATAREMSAIVEDTGRQSGIVAGAAQDADQGVQSVATAAEELSASIRDITRQVSAGAERASDIAEGARQTDVVVSQLADASSRVGQIVELISSIAAQTNLLALNATIEAARAGEAGRGFSVVASEVKSLARQTSHAIQGVDEQVTQIRAATGAAVSAVGAITAGIDDLNRNAMVIATAVEEQGAATGEIARSVQKTAENTRTVTENIVQVSRTVQSNGAAATQVMTSAGELSRQAETLNREVARFLQSVQAA